MSAPEDLPACLSRRGSLTRSKLLLFAGLLAIGGVFVLSFWSAKPQVHGDLTQKDVSAIIKAIKSDMWNDVFPDHSWSTLKRAPRGLVCLLTAQISEVTLVFGNVAKARGSYRFKTEGEGWINLGCDAWTLQREGKVWVVSVRSRKPGPNEKVRPVDMSPSPGKFSESLSNSVRISF
jgi:hypothetical protein